MLGLQSRRTLCLRAAAVALVLASCSSRGDVIDRPDPPSTDPTTIPPEVTTVRPTNSTTAAFAVTNAIQVVFGEPMNAGSISDATFSLWDASGKSNYAGSVTYDAATKTATFKPTSALDKAGSYRPYMNGVMTAAGKTVSPFWWEFDAAP